MDSTSPSNFNLSKSYQPSYTQPNELIRSADSSPQYIKFMGDKYKPPKLSYHQKIFGQYQPVKGFRRFGRDVQADDHTNPSKSIERFMEKEITKPLYRPKLDSIEYPKQENLRWSIGCTKKCNDPNMLPKRDRYRNYYYHNRTEQDIDEYNRFFFPTDHISIRVPEINKVYGENSYLHVKQCWGAHSESTKSWIPRTYDLPLLSNKGSVNYNIINNEDLVKGNVKQTNFLNNNINNKKKGVAEFSDYVNPYNPNFNKEYQDLYTKNGRVFHNCKGIFSDLYDSSHKNGNIYLPFRRAPVIGTPEKELKVKKDELAESKIK